MTAFSSADLPASVNTVEKLATWSLAVLGYLYPNNTVFEVQGSPPVPVISAAPFAVYNSAADWVVTSEWRYISRLSLPLNKDWQKSGKVWSHAISLGADAIPVEFKS